MTALLSVVDLKLALGDTASDLDPLYEQMIERVQAVFEGVCNRHERPFVGVQTARAEVHDGNGAAELFLDYPIAVLSSCVIGADPLAPDETIDTTDKSVLRFAVGRRRLARVDGGHFGAADDPRVVHVTYNAAADLPKAAAAAVLAGCQVIVARLGSEGVASERIGAYSIDYANFVTADMANDPMWKLGVQACWEPRV